MADLQKTVEIIFGAKNDMAAGLGSVEKSLKSIETTAADISAPFARVADAALKTEAALAAMVVGGMALAINESSKFNSAFALVSTAITATGPELEQFRSNVLNYAGTSVKSLSDINAALYSAAQAGIDYTQSIDFISKAEELAVANKANLNTTVELLTGTMNAYGFTVKDLGHINDVFFQSTLIGNQTIDSLGASMGQVVGIAANAGVSFEELSAAIATLTAKGMTTEAAITAVKGVITTIISPSKEAAGAAEKLGLNFSLTTLTGKGFSDMLRDIYVATGGSKEKLVELFSEVRAMNGALMLTGDGMKFFDDALGKIGSAIGVAQEKYKIMVQTFEAQTQMLKNIAQVALVEIGTRLEPAAAKIAGAFGSLLANVSVSINQGSFNELFAYLDKTGNEIATWLMGVAKAFPEAASNIKWDGLIKSFDALGASLKNAFKALFGDIDLTTPEGLAIALNKVITGFEKLNYFVTGIIDSFKPMLKTIGDATNKFTALDNETVKAGGGFSGVMKQVNLLTDNLNIMSNALTVLAISSTAQAVTGLASLLMTVNKLSPAVGTLGGSLGGAAQLLGGAGIAYTAGKAAGEIIRLVPGVDAAAQGFFGWTDKVLNWTGTQKTANVQTAEMTERIKLGNENLAKMRAATDGVKGSVDGYTASIGKVPTAVKTDMTMFPKLDPLTTTETQFKIAQAFMGGDFNRVKILMAINDADVADAKAKIAAALPEKKTVTVEVLADGTKIETTKDMIYKTFPDGKVLITNIGTKADIASLAATKSKIDEVVPASKVMEIQAKIDEAKIKAMSDIVQKSIEWDAKVNIAQIETAGKVIIATFASIDNTITSTGNTISSLTGSYVNSLGKGGSSFIENEIQAESRRRDAAIEMQRKMTDAQVKLLEQQADRIKKGGAMIEIDGKGLQPHLEAFMFEILSAIQVKANAEGMKFLVGTTETKTGT